MSLRRFTCRVQSRWLGRAVGTLFILFDVVVLGFLAKQFLHLSTDQRQFRANAIPSRTIYFGSSDGWNDGSVYALDPQNGTQMWSFQTGDAADWPPVDGGSVFVSTAGGHVIALNGVDGKQLWATSTFWTDAGYPAVAGGVVYTGAGAHNVYALNALSGRTLWSFSTGDLMEASPAEANGIVYTTAFNQVLFAINARTGKEIWHFGMQMWSGSSPVVASGIVYVEAADGPLYAVDAASGREMWHLNGSTSGPTVVASQVFIASDDHTLDVLNSRSGKVVRRIPIGSQVSIAPLVVNGLIYLCSDDGMAWALDAASGREIWQFSLGDIAPTSVNMMDGVVYLASTGTDTNSLSALNARTGTVLWQQRFKVEDPGSHDS